MTRGFLIGPYLPIYGYGALFMTVILTKYQNDLFILFSMAVLWCSILEYITSYIMEKIFKARWWDYSTYPFNVNGRICLVNALFFGLGGVCIIKITNPILFPLLQKVPYHILNIVSVLFLFVIIIDTIISCKIIAKFSKTAHCLLQDRSEELALFVKKNIKENILEEFSNRVRKTKRETYFQLKSLYKNKNILYRRLLIAFPNIEVRNEKIEKLFYKILEKVRKERDEYEHAEFKRSKNKRKK